MKYEEEELVILNNNKKWKIIIQFAIWQQSMKSDQLKELITLN
jgi:hypothetical protein